MQFSYITHDLSATEYSPFYLTHGCATYLTVLAPDTSKAPSTVPQGAVTLLSRLKKAYSAVVIRGQQSKERRIAAGEVDSSPFKVLDSVMIHVPPWPGLPSELQSR